VQGGRSCGYDCHNNTNHQLLLLMIIVQYELCSWCFVTFVVASPTTQLLLPLLLMLSVHEGMSCAVGMGST
jgi:hypothetical protein